ncbi:programmed cell death 1 ligand 1 [Peromyscus leucopus]|uniref:programmed cell death 1 ligand 1 n=1 Tax=Peromyscus leucopus TaxID=10041 RepID=UPI0010A18F03|nr:programmed cell death 1 ligand 1 [Peromyscus leucopus]XP_037061478.1 programmed cell death 1 ligand 1 [Peromyscus leucopus]
MRTSTIVTFTVCCGLLNAFTITAPKDLYVVEYGSNVTIECRFPVGDQLDLYSLVVYWEKDDKQVLQFVEGMADLRFQHDSFTGRARLPKEQLLQGIAGLQITDVKLQDAGVYCCMISYGGADYKRITLKVNAPYHKINHRISTNPATSEHELTCQAEGYPEAEVIWTNSNHQSLSGKITVTSSQSEDKLFNVTSTLRINATANDVFYCTFWRSQSEKNHTAELIIPAPPAEFLPNKRTHWVLLGSFLLLLVAATVLFCLRKQVRSLYVRKCGTENTNSKNQNDTQFEET